MSKRYLIVSDEALCLKTVESLLRSLPSRVGLLHDEMTETIYTETLQSFAANNTPEEVQPIPVMEEGETAIERVPSPPALLRRSTWRGRWHCRPTRCV